VQTGRFVKLYYPTADIDANFKFDGNADFQYYQILLYNYKAHSSANQNVWFEFGERFAIGSAGTSLAYHIGNYQSQNVLSTPAVIRVNDGDGFFRYRSVPVGNNYQIAAGFQFFSNQYVTAFIPNLPPNSGHDQ
jgi:hypothetical protein